METKKTSIRLLMTLCGALMLFIAGCDINDPFNIVEDHDPFTPLEERPDNSLFLGEFELVQRIGNCSPETVTLVIHQFYPKREWDHHIYIHVRNNNSHYGGVNSDLNEFSARVEIVDNTLNAEETIVYDEEFDETGRVLRYFDFAEDYNSFVLLGEMITTEDEYCRGWIRGTGKRIPSDRKPTDDASFGTGDIQGELSNVDADVETSVSSR